MVERHWHRSLPAPDEKLQKTKGTPELRSKCSRSPIQEGKALRALKALARSK
jgi:hypothetical protein